MSHRITIVDIAKELGISTSTVSRALRNHPAISEARKIEVRAVAKALGFEIPLPPPSSPVIAQNRLVACVVPSISHPYFTNVIEKVEDICTQNSYDLILRNSGASPVMEANIVKDLQARGVDGVLFIPSSDDMGPLQECVRTLKTVVITRQVPFCPSVGVNHEEGGRQVAEHFKEIGRKSCLLVGPEEDEKFRGFKAYIQTQRITDFNLEILNIDGWNENFVIDAHKAMLEHFDIESINRIDCVFAKTDLAAVGVLHALKDLGRTVPDDVAVCGFDDTPVAREFRPGITSVAQPVGQIVRSGFAMLKSLMDGDLISPEKSSFSLKAHLVVRGTTFIPPDYTD